MENPLARFKEYVVSSLSNWYTERRLRSLLSESIENGEIIIKKSEDGTPYAVMNAEKT